MLLFSLSSSEERSWSEAEHQESSLLAECVDVLDLLVSREERCACELFPLTVSILPDPTSSHDLHLERDSSAKHTRESRDAIIDREKRGKTCAVFEILDFV